MKNVLYFWLTIAALVMLVKGLMYATSAGYGYETLTGVGIFCFIFISYFIYTAMGED